MAAAAKVFLAEYEYDVHFDVEYCETTLRIYWKVLLS
jgi:hypothetical protein